MALHIHLVVLLLAACAFVLWLRRPAPRFGAVGTVLVAFLPVLSAPFLGPWQTAILGTEGAVEAVTEGGLLALLGWAVLVRNPWMVVGAAWFLLEEIDYGQYFLSFETPGFAWLDGSRTDRLNFHNGPLSIVWRAVPLGVVLFSAVRAERVVAWRERWRFPAFGATAWTGGALAIVLAFAVAAWLGERIADEAFELAMVSLVCATWVKARAGVRPRQNPSP